MKKQIFASLLCTAAVFPNPTLVNLPANSWYTVPNSPMRPVCDPTVDNYQCSSNQSAWSGGTYDPVENLMIVWGGGHGDSDDNAVYAFDIATLTWRRWMNTTGSAQSQDPLSNGDPASRHTYDGVAYITHAKRMFAYGGSQAGNGYGTSVTWTLDVANKDWTNRSPAGTSKPGTDCCNFSCEYDPVSKLVFMHDPNNLYSYDYDNNRWAIALSQSEAWAAHKGVVDTKRNLYFTIGSGELLVYNIATKQNATSAWTSANNSSATGGGYAAAGYDSKADKIVVWRGGAPWILNLDTKTWSRGSGTGAPSSGLSNGTFGRFRYIPADNVFILVNGTDANVCFYKPTAGGGTGTEEEEGKRTTDKGKGQIGISPNPFHGSATLRFSGLSIGKADILNLSGRQVASLAVKDGEAVFDGRNFAPGIYTAILKTGGRVQSQKLFLVK